MRVLLYAIQAMWRVRRGRWFVWRDVPIDVVRRVSAAWRYIKRENSPIAIETVRQARDELRSRKRR